MTAHTYSPVDQLNCAYGHRVGVLWSNSSPDHLFSEVS